MEPFHIETELSAGKKEFEVSFENEAFILTEAGSIAAVIKLKDNKWAFTKGSYSQQDGEKVGSIIQKHLENTKDFKPNIFIQC